MVDWAAAEKLLYEISHRQITRFLDSSIKDQVYGFGFFCDSFVGDVFVVADTIANKAGCSGEFRDIDDQDKWDIGNWQFPAGLFPSASDEQRAFDSAWRQYGKPIDEMEGDEKQSLLEEMCLRVLRDLIRQGAFSAASNLEGFQILGPDDPRSMVLEKKRRLDQRLAEVWQK